MNTRKSKVMLNRHAEYLTFSIGNETLERVDGYNCLGQVVSADANHEREIRRRINVGLMAFGKHTQIINSRLPPVLKIVVYN